MYAFNKHNNKMNITQQKLNVQNKKEKGINSSTNSLIVDVAKDKRYQQHKKSISFFNKLKTKLVSNIDLDLSHYLQTEPFGNNAANVNMHYKINNKKHKIHNAITPNTSITHSQKKMKILAIGDIVGTKSIDYLGAKLWGVRDRYGIDLTVANGDVVYRWGI